MISLKNIEDFFGKIEFLKYPLFVLLSFFLMLGYVFKLGNVSGLIVLSAILGLLYQLILPKYPLATYKIFTYMLSIIMLLIVLMISEEKISFYKEIAKCKKIIVNNDDNNSISCQIIITIGDNNGTK